MAETDGTAAHVDDGFEEAIRTERWAVCTTAKGAPLVSALWSEAQERERAAARAEHDVLKAAADQARDALAMERLWGDELAGMAFDAAHRLKAQPDAPQDDAAGDPAEGEGEPTAGASGVDVETAFRLGVMYLVHAIDRGYEPRVGAALLRPKTTEAIALGFQRREELVLGP
ncbi:MAG TPA: hypothetical protein VF594_06945 [Rubricoccaceae bacterium]